MISNDIDLRIDMVVTADTHTHAGVQLQRGEKFKAEDIQQARWLEKVGAAAIDRGDNVDDVEAQTTNQQGTQDVQSSTEAAPVATTGASDTPARQTRTPFFSRLKA